MHLSYNTITSFVLGQKYFLWWNFVKVKSLSSFIKQKENGLEISRICRNKTNDKRTKRRRTQRVVA